MFKSIKKFLAMLKEKRRQELRRRFFEIRGEVIKFYEAKDAAEGAVDIPAFMRADQTLAEVIKSAKDINFYYGKLLKYRRAV
jgi:hypothetical protein